MKSTSRVLREYGYQPKKSLGQHFLIDENILKKMVQVASLSREDYVLEIGAGLGNLTKYLVEKAGKVIAVEKSKELVKILKNEVPYKNLEIIEGDILRMELHLLQQAGKRLKVVSNLPYNIATEVIFRLLEAKGIFIELYLMLQKEVAERIVAKPKTRDYGILSIIAQFHSEPSILFCVERSSFLPKPKVDSALVRFMILENPRVQVPDYNNFKKMVKAGFSKRRKTIKNALLGSGWGLNSEEVERLLLQAGIGFSSRAEEIDLEGWAKLAERIGG